jgi:hypothetical protein
MTVVSEWASKVHRTRHEPPPQTCGHLVPATHWAHHPEQTSASNQPCRLAGLPLLPQRGQESSSLSHTMPSTCQRTRRATPRGWAAEQGHNKTAIPPETPAAVVPIHRPVGTAPQRLQRAPQDHGRRRGWWRLSGILLNAACGTPSHCTPHNPPNA